MTTTATYPHSVSSYIAVRCSPVDLPEMTTNANVQRPPLPRTLILDYRDSYTNNLLSLFVSLYPDDEVRSKVVVVQADEISW